MTMPERVLAYVSVFGTYSQIKDEYHDVECILVPESRLLAAEARVREVEAELGAALDQVMLFGSDIATLRAALLAAEARVREMEAERDARRERKVALMECEEREATLRAERDALVPLLRYFLAEFVDDGDEVPRHDCGFVKRPESGYCEFHDKWGEARAILAREET